MLSIHYDVYNRTPRIYMIAGTFHNGSGLGNQLHRYVSTRVVATDLGVRFGMDDLDNFKGKDFMNLDMGIAPQWLQHTFTEQRIDNEHGVDIRPYDERIKEIKDHTRMDGEFQDERYFNHRLDEVREWLKVEPLEMPDELCIINFRGGEYVGVPDLFLPKSYWETAILWMKEINPLMKFEVHTDDPATAREFFPSFPIVSNVELNWRSIRYAKYLILSNSSFAILPALIGDAKLILAPKFWAGRNVGYWKLPQNEYKRFQYI